MSLFLTPDELTEWTGFKRRSKIVAQLRRWHIPFRTPADGWPRVPRSAIEGAREAPTLVCMADLELHGRPDLVHLREGADLVAPPVGITGNRRPS